MFPLLELENLFGANKSRTYVGSLAQNTALLLVVAYTILQRRKSKEPSLEPFKVWIKRILPFASPIAIFDIGIKYLTMYGITKLGTSLYVVIYSFVTVTCALMRRFVLHRHLSVLQWFAIVMITSGLVYNGVAKGSLTDDATAEGIFIVLLAAILDSFVYVLAERAFIHPRGPTPIEMTSFVAAISFIYTVLYIAGYSAAGMWHSWVIDPIRSSDCEVTDYTIVLVWVAEAAVFIIHYLTFMLSIENTSSVATGVSKSLQSASVFFTGHLLFCKEGFLFGCSSKKTCLTTAKVISAIIVFFGTALYAIGSVSANAKKKVKWFKCLGDSPEVYYEPLVVDGNKEKWLQQGHSVEGSKSSGAVQRN